MLRKILFVFLIQVSLFSYGGSVFSDAMKLFKEDKYSLSYVEFEKSQNPESLFYLGMMNLTGKGVDKDVDKAKEYWISGYEKYDIKSSISLALLVIKSDVSKTVSILTDAANTTNDPRPMFELSKIYADKKLPIYDLKKSFEWSLMASKLGHIQSQAGLGIKYYYGDGTEKDLNEAIKWYTLSANEGFENSQYALGIIHLQRNRPEHAIGWLEKAAEKDHLEAILTLADYYQFEDKKDNLAEHYLNRAISKGYLEAKLQLGLLYLMSDNPDARDGGIKTLSNCFIADNNDACMSPFIRIFMHNKYREMISSEKYEKIINKI